MSRKPPLVVAALAAGAALPAVAPALADQVFRYVPRGRALGCGSSAAVGIRQRHALERGRERGAPGVSPELARSRARVTRCSW